MEAYLSAPQMCPLDLTFGRENSRPRLMFLVLAILTSLVNGCIRTSETTHTTTTTDSSVTTTTTTATTTNTDSTTSTTSTTTTTTTTGSCSNCDPAIVMLEPDPDPVNGHPPTSALGPPQAGTGCAVLVVTCTPIGTNQVSLLTFFPLVATGMDLGQADVNNPAVGMLVCNTAGEWIYTALDINGNPVSNAVGSAQCLG